MRRSDVLFGSHEYEAALEHANKEAAGRGNDTFKIGPILTVGQCLLVLGRFDDAKRHLEELAAGVHFGAKIGCHFTYAGLASWFAGDCKRAVEIWESGLTAGYQSQEGMEIPWVLFYAAARRADCYSRRRAVTIIQDKSKRLPDCSTTFVVNEFLLNRISEEAALKRVSELCEGRFHENLTRQARSRIDFAAGVHALADGDVSTFYQRMVACASMVGYDTVDVQLVIAECELRQGPPKWRKQLEEFIQLRVATKSTSRRKRQHRTKRI